MVLRDVHRILTQQRTDATNDTGNVVIRENEQCFARMHVDMECTNACYSWDGTGCATPDTDTSRIPPSIEHRSRENGYLFAVTAESGDSVNESSIPRASASDRALITFRRSCSVTDSSVPTAAADSSAPRALPSISGAHFDFPTARAPLTLRREDGSRGCRKLTR